MKIAQLIKKLEKIQAKQGNLEVFFAGPNYDTDPYSVNAISVQRDGDDYPEDYNMPAKFVCISNG